MDEEITDLQRSRLQVIKNDAKQRILFYYKNILDEQTIKNIEILLDGYNYGFDLDRPVAAYCRDDVHCINVTRNFLSIKNYEVQVGIMVHEMNHAISAANVFNKKVEEKYDVNYVSSYQLIEEGLADIMADLIMNYYYDKKNPSVNYEPFRTACGLAYSYYRDFMKTILAIMEFEGIDKTMLQEYYFGDKGKLFKYIAQIGGEKLFDLVRMNIDNSKSLDANSELFAALEKKWGEVVSKRASMKDGKKGYNKVYYSDNFLIEHLDTTYYIQQIIERANIGVDNVTLEEIQKIFVATNGLISRLQASWLVPSIIDRMIASWIKNCKIEEVHAIKGIIPNIFNLLDGKYYKLLIEKVLKESKEKELSEKDLSILVGAITYKQEAYDSELSTSIGIVCPSVLVFADEIYPKMTEEQKNMFGKNYEAAFKFGEYRATTRPIYKQLLDAYNVDSINDLSALNVLDILYNRQDFQDLADKINKFGLDDIISHIVTAWITNFLGEPDYIFTIFPRALDNSELLDLLKWTWGYTDENIKQLRKSILGEPDDKKH